MIRALRSMCVGSIALAFLLVGAVNCKTPTPSAQLLDDEGVEGGEDGDGNDGDLNEQLRRQLARQGLVGVVGSDFHSLRDNGCVNCHADMDGAKLHEWGGKMHAFVQTCDIKDLYTNVMNYEGDRLANVAACVKDNVRESGMFRVGVKTSVVEALFTRAERQDDMRAVTGASMPPGRAQGLDDEEFANLFMWVTSYEVWNDTALADIRAVLINEGGNPPPAPLATCQDSVTEEMKSHIRSMHRGGWTARNTANPNMQMFGCKPGVDDPKLCFSQRFFRGAGGVARFPQKPEFVATRSATGVVRGSKIRLLKSIGSDYTSYWSRVSADGRFIGVGGRGFERLDAEIDSNQRDQVTINASYDPGFFPNNSGFVFQGGGMLVCNQKILDDPQVLEVGSISVGGGFDDWRDDDQDDGESEDPEDDGETPQSPEEKYCSVSGSVSLYQSVGTSITGDNYFYLAGGNWVGDDGSSYGDLPVSAFAYDDSRMSLHLARSQGDDAAWADANQVAIVTPYQGDWFLSPSTALMVGREATRPEQTEGESVHNGYVIHSIDVEIEGEGESRSIANVATQEVAKICLNGRKPTLSFDERFLATHHYVKKHDFAEYGFESADDPAFQELVDNSADIWIVDMWKGKKARVTNMGVGRKALYPHFRSDGWMYFLVKDYAPGEFDEPDQPLDEWNNETLYMASDAAIIMARD